MNKRFYFFILFIVFLNQVKSESTMDCELTNREQSNERIKLTCINKKITGYI